MTDTVETPAASTEAQVSSRTNEQTTDAIVNSTETSTTSEQQPIEAKSDTKSTDANSIEVKTVDLNNESKIVSAKSTSTKSPKSTSTKPNNPDQPNKQNKPTLMVETDKDDTLHTMSFNQDGGCLSVGTGSGFRICNVHPFVETIRRKLDGVGGGIAQIEMLYRTNLLALTGTNTTHPSQFPPNKVMIYDDHDQRIIGELNFRQKVIATKLRRDRIIVVLRDRIYIYNFSDMKMLEKIHTGDNPCGLCGISMDNGGVGGSTVVRAEDVLGVRGGERNGLVLACPSTRRGQVRVELYGLRRTTFVDAHESALGALALSVDGSLLATASERGTVIRLFDTRGVTVGGGRTAANNIGDNSTSLSSSIPLREFRRGVERATITCLAFSPDSCWLAASSDHGTVHIFQSQDPNISNNSTSKATSKSISSMTGKAIRMLPKLVVSPTRYLVDGEQSVAQVKGVPHPRACAFVPDRECTIAIAGEDDYGNGCLLLAEFGKAANNKTNLSTGKVDQSADDSEARRLSYHRFFKKDGAAAMHGKGNKRRVKSKDWKAPADLIEGGAFIDDSGKIDLKMSHIHIGESTEDDFVPIDHLHTKT